MALMKTLPLLVCAMQLAAVARTSAGPRFPMETARQASQVTFAKVGLLKTIVERRLAIVSISSYRD